MENPLASSLAILAAKQDDDTLVGKLFVVGVMVFLFGGLGIWSLRMMKGPGSFLAKLGELGLAILCFGAVFLTIKAEFF